MLVYGIVAAALCVGVVVALLVTTLRAREIDRQANDRDRELVNDCLANAERVMDLTDRARGRQVDDTFEPQPSLPS